MSFLNYFSKVTDINGQAGPVSNVDLYDDTYLILGSHSDLRAQKLSEIDIAKITVSSTNGSSSSLCISVDLEIFEAAYGLVLIKRVRFMLEFHDRICY